MTRTVLPTTRRSPSAAALDADLDYFNIIAGTSASSAGAVHIVPPMTVGNAYLAPFAQRLKQAMRQAGLRRGPHQPAAGGRNGSSREGAADMCGMTRAMICDPQMPTKAREGRSEDIRACIACNQACIGHAQLGLSISCIQYPGERARTRISGPAPATRRPRKVMVVGGGPAA